MDLVEHHDGLGAAAEEERRVAHHLLDDGQVTVDVEDPLLAQALGQRRLAGAADPGQPDDRRFLPGLLEASQPERPLNHDSVLYLQYG